MKKTGKKDEKLKEFPSVDFNALCSELPKEKFGVDDYVDCVHLMMENLSGAEAVQRFLKGEYDSLRRKKNVSRDVIDFLKSRNENMREMRYVHRCEILSRALVVLLSELDGCRKNGVDVNHYMRNAMTDAYNVNMRIRTLHNDEKKVGDKAL